MKKARPPREEEGRPRRVSTAREEEGREIFPNPPESGPELLRGRCGAPRSSGARPPREEEGWPRLSIIPAREEEGRLSNFGTPPGRRRAVVPSRSAQGGGGAFRPCAGFPCGEARNSWPSAGLAVSRLMREARDHAAADPQIFQITGAQRIELGIGPAVDPTARPCIAQPGQRGLPQASCCCAPCVFCEHRPDLWFGAAGDLPCPALCCLEDEVYAADAQ